MTALEEMNLIYGIRLILIPSSEFYMGRLPLDREYPILTDPVKKSIEKSFWMSDTPITNRQYASYLDDANKPIPTYTIEHWDFSWVKVNGFDKYLLENPNAPLVGVNYKDASAFISWLTTKSNLAIRFPTEAEFEYASKADCSCKYYCQKAVNIKKSLRDYGEPSNKKVPSVKRYEANSFKLFDMQGLIWQWCSDWFWPLENVKNLNPKDPHEKPSYTPWKGHNLSPGRVIRGGSFNYSVLHSRCSSRHYTNENDRNFNLGFRIAANL